MNSLFEQLPPELLQALNRWYLFSVLALCITLVGISYLHISTSLKLTTMASTNTELAQQAKPVSPDQEAALSVSENELKKLIAQHTLFFKLFGAILGSIPQHIQLTFFSIESEKISCKGIAYSMDDITKFMRTLQEKVNLSITELDLQQPSQSLLSFTLSAHVAP